MPSQPIVRTLSFLRKQGYDCSIVERWNPYSKRKHDAFGFIDIIAVKPDTPILAIQATGGSGGNFAERRKKILSEPRVLTWLQAGGRIEIHAPTKRKIKRGGIAFRYEQRVEEITLDDFDNLEDERLQGLG